MLALGALALFTTGCDGWEPQNPRAGQIVRTVRAPGVARATPGKFSTVSVYEQSAEGHDRITGKRIRFRVEHSLVDVKNRRSGPMHNLTLMFNRDGILPYEGERFSKAWVYATLESTDRGGNLTRENMTSVDCCIPQMSDIKPGALLPLPDKVCGFDVFRVVIPTLGERTLKSTSHDPLDAALAERFGGSVVFASGRPQATYDTVIGCPKYNPTCTALTSYRGWPVNITFRSRHLCEYPEIHDEAVALFDRFLVEETGRSTGQADTRWTPARFHEAGVTHGAGS